MKERLWIITTILGLIFIFASLTNFGIKVYNINNLNTPYFKILRSTYGDTTSESEYEEEILPIHIETAKHNAKVKLYYRLLGIILVTGVVVGITKNKNTSG